MKNRFVYLSFLLTLCSCNIDNSVIESSTIKESDTMSDYKNEEIESLKVLCIGNSFSVDTIEHVPNIALHSNVKNVKFGNLYIGGCSINKHFNNATNNLANYEYFINEGKGWSSTLNHSIYEALQSESWDYISIQHGTADGSRYADINSYLNLENLIEYIKTNSLGNPKIVFNMTWVGERGSHEELLSVFNNNTQKYYEEICKLTRDKVSKCQGLDIVSPTGTAIQNARTAALGSLNRDGYHLSLAAGRYVAGLTFFMALTGKNISDIDWAPSGMNKYMKDVAIESACNAMIKPFEVTKSKIQVPSFEWPSNCQYGIPATPDNPYYEHCSKEQPNVSEKIDLLQYFNILPTLPIVSSTLQSGNNLNLNIDLEKTPYLYFSFIIPEGSDFTFSIYSDTNYSPWLLFLDASKGNCKLTDGAENWDSLFKTRAQYTTKTQTGCIDLREYANKDATKWVISMMKLYSPKGDGIVMSYFMLGSKPIENNN